MQQFKRVKLENGNICKLVDCGEGVGMTFFAVIQYEYSGLTEKIVCNMDGHNFDNPQKSIVEFYED